MIEEQETEIRKHYIDNLRNLTILLLFPVHTFMIWNNFGSRFYIWQGENKILSTLIVLVNPWFMPILFALAGIIGNTFLHIVQILVVMTEHLLPDICGLFYFCFSFQ